MANQEVVRDWQIRVDSQVFGPFTDDEMLRFVSEGRVVAETDVSHPRLTQGDWLQADFVKPLRERLEIEAAAAPAPPPIATLRQVAPPPALSVPAARSRANGYFRWILLGIWGLWGVACGVEFTRTFFEYNAYHGGRFWTNYGAYGIENWLRIVIAKAFLPSLMLTLPATIASVIAYFFTRPT